MRVAVDCRWIFPKLSGIGKHTDNLIEGLKKIDRQNTYLFLNKLLMPYGLFSLRNQLRLPRLLRRLDVDLYHSTNYMIPLFMKRKIKVVVTIHDMIPWKFPHYTPKAKKTRFFWFFKTIMILSARRADKIIAVSENTAADICNCLKVNPEKISVVYNGMDPEFFEDRKVEKEGYILFVGRQDPYKNLEGLVRAYAVLIKKYNIKNRLLVVGDDDPRYPEVKELVKKLDLADRVIFWGYADKKDMKDLYHKAGVLVMPSFYEGFGLPAVEAMACGTPVIVSNTPALREVAGDNAIIVDPYNIEDISVAIYRVLTDKALSERLSLKGRIHAKQFTIERMARETLGVYESCISA